MVLYNVDFPGDSDGKESACNAGNSCSIPGLGRSLGEGSGYLIIIIIIIYGIV